MGEKLGYYITVKVNMWLTVCRLQPSSGRDKLKHKNVAHTSVSVIKHMQLLSLSHTFALIDKCVSLIYFELSIFTAYPINICNVSMKQILKSRCYVQDSLCLLFQINICQLWDEIHPKIFGGKHHLLITINFINIPKNQYVCLATGFSCFRIFNLHI